jgi:hypothetical protein
MRHILVVLGGDGWDRLGISKRSIADVIGVIMPRGREDEEEEQGEERVRGVSEPSASNSFCSKSNESQCFVGSWLATGLTSGIIM